MGWGGLTLAKDEQGSCHRVEPIFHFGNRGDSRLGSIWEKSEVLHGSVVFCKGRKLHSSSEPAKERTAALGRAAGCWGMPGALQGGHGRAGERQQGLGELHRRGQEHHAAAAGIRQKERVGGHQWGAKLATYQWVEAMLQWKKTIRRKEVHPSPPPPAQQAAWVPTPQ